MKLRQLWRDFNTVRLGASRSVSHVTRMGDVVYFDMSRETRAFGQAYGRLPRWMLRLAMWMASRRKQMEG